VVEDRRDGCRDVRKRIEGVTERICHVMSRQDTSDRALQYDVDVDIETSVATNDFCAFVPGPTPSTP